MFNSNDYLGNTPNTNSKNHTETIKEIVKYVVDNKDAFAKELESLSNINKKTPNNIFPIKIKNLTNGYNCFEILNEWYNIKTHNNEERS